MLLKIKTSKIDFHLESKDIKFGYHIDGPSNKEFISFLKEIITKVQEDSNKLKTTNND